MPCPQIGRGNFSCTLSSQRPILARDFVRVLVMKTSASERNFIMTSRPFSLLRFSATETLVEVGHIDARFSPSLDGMQKTTA